MSEMHEVYVGCKICGRRVLTNDSPLVRRTCDACKAIKKRERNRRTDARRKAARCAVKAKWLHRDASSAASRSREPISSPREPGRNGRASSAATHAVRPPFAPATVDRSAPAPSVACHDSESSADTTSS